MLEITSPLEMAEELGKLYNDGMTPGDSVGWESLDPLYTVAPGFWTVVTGIPSDGKSTWLDNVMLNLTHKGWKFVVYSPENQPLSLHLAHLIEKRLKRPFRERFYNRMAPQDLAIACSELDESFRFLRVPPDSNVFPGMGQLLFTANEIIETEWQYEKVGLVIDPWNEMDHAPVSGMNETQMTNHELMMFRHWIRQRQAHGWIVAHPQKPARDRAGAQKPVGLYDINGSAAYYNKCDHGIIIRRLSEENLTEVIVEKCRFRHLGKKGSCVLRFNVGLGTYDDQEQVAGYRNMDEPCDF